MALICAAVLTGCVKYRPLPLDPPRAEQEFRARTLPGPGPLGLTDLVTAALRLHPDLDVARAQVRAAEAVVVTARARPNPSLSTGGGWTNSPESPVVFHFDPMLTLETAGKRGWRILAAEKAAEAARVELTEAEWRARSRVRAAWLDHVMAVQSLEILRRERDVRAEAVAMLEKRMGVGEASRPDVNVARTALIAVEVEAKAAETTVAESRAALASAVGVVALPELDAATLPPAPASPRLDDVQKAGLLHRADVRRSLLEYAAAEADLRLEIANQYPDIQLSPGYGFDEGHHKIQFSPGFTIPMFNRNQGPIAEAEARRAQAQARFNALQAQAIGEMEIALARYRGALAELSDSERRLVAIQQTREAAMRRAVQAGEEDRLALAGVRVEGAVAARARLDAMRRVQSAFGSLEDAVQQPLEGRP